MNTINIEFLGQDAKIQKAVSIARNVAVTKAPVLIIGEVGVGKKTLAQFIHDNSTRADGQITVVDCSCAPVDVENAILGFRDETTGRFAKGALETTNGGTVVFSNIDCLEDNFQKRLFQILNELSDYDIDLRIISTTTKNISKLVGTGRFYRGLYTFISANAITLTPLRERIADLEALTRHYISQYSVNDQAIEMDETALEKLLGHYWTHNVEELKAVIESTISNLQGNIITGESLAIGEKKIVNTTYDTESDGIRLMSLKEAEKLLIKKALIHTSENRTQAAKILGVSIRTLRNKINEYRNGGSAYFVNLR